MYNTSPDDSFNSGSDTLVIHLLLGALGDPPERPKPSVPTPPLNVPTTSDRSNSPVAPDSYFHSTTLALA